jgi:beta-galactosidase
MRSLFTTALLFALAGCPGPSTTDAGDATADSLDAMDQSTPDVPDVQAPDVMPPWLGPFNPSPRANFPSTFFWGSATAPYQVEGMLHNTEWYQWESMGHVANNDHADDGDQSLAFYMADVNTLTQTHQNAYRFGIEWARVFPTATQWQMCRNATPATRQTVCHAAADPTGLAYYHSLLAALRTQHITPLVTMQHYSLPTYVNDLTMDYHTQGWQRADLVNDLAAWAAFVAGEYGGEVDWWVTINEPTAFAVTAYFLGAMPPGIQFQPDAVIAAFDNMVHAHAAMYDAIHANDTMIAQASGGPISPAQPAYVSIAQNLARFFGLDPTDSRDAAAAQLADQLYNRAFYEAMVHGNLDANLNGHIDPGEPMNDPALRNRADYLGMNYYTTEIVQHNSAIPILHAIPIPPGNAHGLPLTDYGWDIYPQGLYDTLMWVNAYALPIVISENGIADHADVNRARYIAEHLAAVAAAMQAGAHVIGYFHWSNIDNFEWSAGFCPHFGLFSVDRTSPTRTRTMRPSAMVYQQIIAAGQVTDTLLSAQSAYQSQTTFCAFQGTPDAGH